MVKKYNLEKTHRLHQMVLIQLDSYVLKNEASP